MLSRVVSTPAFTVLAKWRLTPAPVTEGAGVNADRAPAHARAVIMSVIMKPDRAYPTGMAS
jgi:hypothetical protein